MGGLSLFVLRAAGSVERMVGARTQSNEFQVDLLTQDLC